MVATPAPKPVHRLHPVLRAPFAADTWRSTGYALVALPVAIVSVPLALVGGPAGRLQRRAAGLLPGGLQMRRAGLLPGGPPTGGLRKRPAGLLWAGAGRRVEAHAGSDEAEPAESRGRALLHAILALPLDAAVFAITVYGWLLVVLNLGFPLRPLVGLSADGAGSWGGPSVAGAWAVHAVTGGLISLLLMPWVVRGLTGLQRRLLRALLG